MIDEFDDTLEGYVPGGKRRKMTAGEGLEAGIMVTVGLDGKVRGLGEPEREPTRYALALRRQASNRARQKAGQQQLPAIGAGSCERCEGWGVLGKSRQRCPDCGGNGEAWRPPPLPVE